MDLDISCRLVEFLKPYGHHVNLYMGDDLYIEKHSPEAARYQALTRTYLNVVEDLGDLLRQRGQGATKFSMIASPRQVQHVMKEAAEAFGKTLQVMPSKPHFLEFGRPDIGKGVALSQMARALGITRHQVMAIGDSPNDQDMIEYAGWGIAMGNAVDSIKEKARWITADNDADGVALALEQWVLKN